MKVLIANRGEIAARIDRAVRGLGWSVQHVHTAEEAASAAPDSELLPRPGVAGYLDVAGIVDAALRTDCSMIHPGYGFLSESAELACACATAGLTFVGADAGHLELFGDKGRARAHADAAGVPVLDATRPDATVDDIAALLAMHHGGVMIKAVHGGGGRGMRAVTEPDQLTEAYARCRSEARRAFGEPAVYAERLVASARHIEVQILGDGSGGVITLGDRDCSVQRRNQKVLEVAPAVGLTAGLRSAVLDNAKALTGGIGYRGLATVEFLLDAARGDAVFVEVNPRLQVEHTVTEEVTGIDLVQSQLRIAAGARLSDVDLPHDVTPRPGIIAIQARVNAEENRNGTLVATTGVVRAIHLPTARVDTGVDAGTVVDGTFDSLLAKVITVTDGDIAAACAATDRALDDLRIEGVLTNQPLLHQLLGNDAVRSGRATTRLVDDLLAAQTAEHATDAGGDVVAVMDATVVAITVEPGSVVGARTTLVTLEAMKMEHPVSASHPGTVTDVLVEVGDQITAGTILARVEADPTAAVDEAADASIDLDHIRPDLADLVERKSHTLDSARTVAVEKRHARGHLTAREWIDALVDPGSFREFGALAVAAQRSRRSLDDLIATTPADGVLTGLATINGSGDADSGARECVIVAYDYTVLAGTQGYFNHRKTDRVLEIAADRELPVILFAEGGGGRPGDTDTADLQAAGLTVPTFATMGALSGRVPTIGIVTGRCFAGNAALLGCCDVIIATRDANLGMAGPAMISGGGLGHFAPEDIGPMSVQGANGVVDIVVDDDAQAIATARRYLAYFQGAQKQWSATDQRHLRHDIGENRKLAYDVRQVIAHLADTDSVLELRRDFGVGSITALVRIDGRAYGLVANNPAHLGGAIDADGADKMARFLQLCDAHGLPIVSLCDTPGFMVGPEVEKTATVRHFSRLFIVASHLVVPVITVVLRKAYGLGAQAMAAGGFTRPMATIAWPTGEIGGMGLEGAVQLGYAKELAAITDPGARQERYDELVAEHYEKGKAVNAARVLELDDVIDPADTRRWINATVGTWHGAGSGRFVDAW